jgi:broad specificity phosphatase PhoE
MPTTVWLVSHAANAALRSGTFPLAPGTQDDDAEAVLDARAMEALGDWRERWHARLSRGGGADGAMQKPRVLTSPAAIARASAKAAGFEAASEAALAEAAFGAWQGKRLTELAREAPAALASWTRDPSFRPPGGGESFDDVLRRVSAWLDALPESANSVIAFTHASVIRAAILRALDAPSVAFRSVEIAPLSVTALRRAQHGWVWLSASA